MQDLKHLKLGERKKPTKDSFDYRQQAIEKWVAELPRGSVGETAQLIYTALNELNSLNIKFQDRMICLELLREPVHYVTESMKKHFITTTFPISQRAWKTAVACRSIYAAMADGYKIVALDLSTANILFYDKKLFITAIHRALSYIGQVLLNCYQVYEAYFFDYWNDLNRLYAFAEHKKLHDTLVVDPMNQYINKTTICDEYIRSLLLFMAEPDHLRQGEVSKIYINLERWLSKVNLFPLLKCSEKEMIGKSVVNLQSEFPPRTLRSVPEEGDLNHFRYIEVEKLLAVVKEELDKAEKSISSTLVGLNLEHESLPANLIHRLMESWSGLKKRHFNRQKINQNVDVSIGLHNIHQLIERDSSISYNVSSADEQKTNNKNFTVAANFEGHETDDVNVTKTDVWDMVYPTSLPNSFIQQDDEEPEPVSSYEELCTSDSWTMVNQSPEGFCLICVKNCGEKIQVGELIGINPEDDTCSTWSSVGMVRWMRSYGENGLVIGGGLLSPNAEAVGLKSFSEEPDESEYRRALFFPELKALKRPASLVVLALSSRPGQIVKLHIPGKKDRQIKLTKLVGSNNLISQFLFVPMGEGNSTDIEPSEKSEFDDVWKVL